MIFGLPAATAAEKGATGAALILGAIASALIAAAMVFVSLVVTAFFFGKIREAPLLPALLWTYSAATSPWAFLASKEDNEFSAIATFFLEIGYIIGAALLLFNPGEYGLLSGSLIVAMTLNWIFQQYTVIGSMQAGRRT